MVIELFVKVSHNKDDFTALQVIFTKHKVTKGSFSNLTFSSDCLCRIIWGSNGFQLFFGSSVKGQENFFVFILEAESTSK